MELVTPATFMHGRRRDDVSAVGPDIDFRRDPHSVLDIRSGMSVVAVPPFARLDVHAGDRQVFLHPLEPRRSVRIDDDQSGNAPRHNGYVGVGPSGPPVFDLFLGRSPFLKCFPLDERSFIARHGNDGAFLLGDEIKRIHEHRVHGFPTLHVCRHHQSVTMNRDRSFVLCCVS